MFRLYTCLYAQYLHTKYTIVQNGNFSQMRKRRKQSVKFVFLFGLRIVGQSPDKMLFAPEELAV